MVTFQIPTGPMNLAQIFPGVDFDNMQEYYVTLKDHETDTEYMNTPTFRRACCCGSDVLRLFFVNYLGGIDALNFKIITEDTSVSSTQWKKPLKYPLQKYDGGTQRFNVTSNELVTVENYCYGEQDQEWLKELMASPNAWLQWNGTQDQAPDYIPVVIKDGTFGTRKYEERYRYIMRIQFEYANENQILRT